MNLKTTLQAKLDEMNITYNKNSSIKTLTGLIKEEMKGTHNVRKPVRELDLSVRIKSDYDFEQKRITEGYKYLVDHADESKTFLIRKLHEYKIASVYVAKMLNTHYSFVYNTLEKMNEDIISKRTISDDIKELYDEGLTVNEIKTVLDRHYSFVFGVIKKYKKELNS